MQNLLNNLKGMFAKDWWIEILTDSPHCIYYFGPFQSEAEAVQAEADYVTDLKQEGAVIIQVTMMKRPAPAQLTVEYPDAFSRASTAQA